MVQSVTELFEGRTDEDGVTTRRTVIRYLIRDDTAAGDEATALATFYGLAPTSVRGLPRLQRRLVERISDTVWIGEADFGRPEKMETTADDYNFTFDTTGETKHITQSISTVNSYGDEAADDLGGAIGYDGERVNGCDIIVPSFRFTETHPMDYGDVDEAYKIAVMELTGKVNDATFRGFAAGEVLFLGATGARRGTLVDDDWEITYSFSVSKNQTGLTVGDITPIAKGGWEYLWVQYGEDVDAVANVLVRKPVAVYVEQVYDEGDFTTLGLGADPA